MIKSSDLQDGLPALFFLLSNLTDIAAFSSQLHRSCSFTCCSQVSSVTWLMYNIGFCHCYLPCEAVGTTHNQTNAKQSIKQGKPHFCLKFMTSHHICWSVMKGISRSYEELLGQCYSTMGSVATWNCYFELSVAGPEKCWSCWSWEENRTVEIRVHGLSSSPLSPVNMNIWVYRF